MGEIISVSLMSTANSNYYYGQRFYNPELGRWLSRDPIGDFDFVLKRALTQPDNGAAIVPLRQPLVLSGTLVRALISQAIAPATKGTYLYVGNSPIPRIDYLGLDDCVCPTGSTTGKKPKLGFNPNTVIDFECTGVPDLWFTMDCRAHDYCYATCNADKSQCDQDFLDDMQATCNYVFAWNPVMKFYCLSVANSYYAGSVAFGDSSLAGDQAFSELQDAACEPCCCE